MAIVGVISYAAGAAGFLVLFLLLLTSWRGRLQGALLVVAVLLSFLWALLAAVYAGTGFQRLGWLYSILEVGRSVAWIAFLLRLLKPLVRAAGPLSRSLRLAYPALLGLAGLLMVVDGFPHLVGDLPWRVDLSLFGHIGLAIGGLALVEQLFRNTRPERRWASKFLYLGIGTLMAYDFFLYADTLLFKRIDYQIWYARGLVNAMVVPLLAVSASRNPEWSLEIFVSRRMVIHSAAIFGAGLYLLIMAGVGYYIRLYGGTWGTAIQLVFLVGAGLLLLVMMFSGQLQAKTRIFFSKHFFHYKYDYREEWLKFIGTLSTGESSEPLRERAIRAIAQIVHSNGGMLWTRDDHNHFFLAVAWNMGQRAAARSEPGDSALIDFLERRQWVIELDACEAEPELYAGLVLPRWLRELPQAWLVVPLLQGQSLQGFVVLTKPLARQQINWEDRDLLKTAGRQVASYVAFLDTSEALMNARQFEAFNRLSAYVVHDLKNVIAQLSLVVANAARHKHNPAFVEDAIGTVENAANRMNRMLAQLRKGSVPVREATFFKVNEALQEAVAARAGQPPVPRLTTRLNGEARLRASRDRFTAVLEHLIQNAQEATEATGSVTVRAYPEGRKMAIEIADTGCGMDERFIRERLFQPFNTTKGNAGMGIGVYESREFVHALGGEIEVSSQPGAGTTFVLRLPLPADAAGVPPPTPEPEVALCASRPRSY